MEMYDKKTKMDTNERNVILPLVDRYFVKSIHVFEWLIQ